MTPVAQVDLKWDPLVTPMIPPICPSWLLRSQMDATQFTPYNSSLSLLFPLFYPLIWIPESYYFTQFCRKGIILTFVETTVTSKDSDTKENSCFCTCFKGALIKKMPNSFIFIFFVELDLCCKLSKNFINFYHLHVAWKHKFLFQFWIFFHFIMIFLSRKKDLEIRPYLSLRK